MAAHARRRTARTMRDVEADSHAESLPFGLASVVPIRPARLARTDGAAGPAGPWPGARSHRHAAVRTRFRPAESLDPPQRRRHDPGGGRPRADRACSGGRPRRRHGSRSADGHRVPATDDVLRPRLGPWCRDVATRRPGSGTRRSGRGDDPRPLLRRYDDRVEGSGDDRSRAPARRLQGHRRQTLVVHGRGGAWSIEGIATTFPANARLTLAPVSAGSTTYKLRVVSAGGTQLYASLRSAGVNLLPGSAAATLQLDSKGSTYDTYRGKLRIRLTTSIRVIDDLGLDAYLRGVVPAEMPPSWPAEALKAQAIACPLVRRLPAPPLGRPVSTSTTTPGRRSTAGSRSRRRRPTRRSRRRPAWC